MFESIKKAWGDFTDKGPIQKEERMQLGEQAQKMFEEQQQFVTALIEHFESNPQDVTATTKVHIEQSQARMMQLLKAKNEFQNGDLSQETAALLKERIPEHAKQMAAYQRHVDEKSQIQEIKNKPDISSFSDTPSQGPDLLDEKGPQVSL